MASRLKERHPIIPGLVRLPRTAAQTVYPYLPTGVPQRVRGVASKALLSDAERGATSPLGNVASPRKAK
jgi:hypothetical protein